MHRIFGIKENALYENREGAYLIPMKDNKIGVVQTPKGYFFIGGGLNGNENHRACIERECMEEAGYEVTVKEIICSAETYCQHPTIGFFHPIQTYYSGELKEKISEPTEEDHKFMWVGYDALRGKMYLEMQNWALEQFLQCKAL